MCWGLHSWSWRAAGCAGVLTPGPGEPQGVLGSSLLVPESHKVCWGPHSWSWRAAGCAGSRCYSAVNRSIKAVDHTVNSPHFVLGSELVAEFRVKTKASTPCGSLGPGLRSAALHQAVRLYIVNKHIGFGLMTIIRTFCSFYHYQ